MSQVDFIIAMSIVIGVIAFSISYVSNDLSSQIEQMNILELKQAAELVENKIQTENMKIVRARFEDTDGEDHSENILISFSGDVSDARIYKDGNLISTGENSLSFSLFLTANSIEYYDIFYSGTSDSISIGGSGVSSRLLYEQNYLVVPDECIIDYDLMRQEIEHNFRISYGLCEVGPEPPKGTVVARYFPVRLKSSLKYETANILVW